MRLSEGGVLIFDIEVRPTAWIGGDFVGKSMTAWAASWLDSDEMASGILTRATSGIAELVMPIAGILEAADLLVGHYVRGFDLPIINADLERAGDYSLPRLLTVDTKLDRIQGIGLSESLDNLSNRYALLNEKMPMREPMWEEHNCWQTPRSVVWVRDRVESDVRLTKELYLKLEEHGRLKAPKAWDPSTAKIPRYRG